MKKALVSLSLPALGLVLMLGGSAQPVGAVVQYRESEFSFIRIEGESTDKKHQGELEILSAARPMPQPTARDVTSGMASGKQTKTYQTVKCSDIAVSVAMADGSVKPAKYNPDALGGCRYSLALARPATGRVKVKFPWLPGGSDWVVQDSPPLTLVPGGTLDGSMHASLGKLTFSWHQVAGPST